MPVTELRGVDEFYNSAGVQLAPLGFGFQSDWELLGRVEVTGAVASVDFGGWDPALYDEIEISCLGVTNTSDGDFYMRVSTDGGVNFLAGASDYSWIFRRFDLVASPVLAQSGDDLSSAIIVADSLGNVAGEIADIKIECGSMATSEIKMFRNRATARLLNSVEYAFWGGGAALTSSDVDGFQFLMSTGNIDGGTFIVRGRRKTPVSLISQDDWVVIGDQAGISAVATHDVFWPDQVYDEIEVTVSGLVIGTDNQSVALLMSTNGSTFLAGASDYRWAWDSRNSNNAAGSGASNGDVLIQTFPALGTGTDEHVDGTIIFRNVSNTTRKKIVQFQMGGILQGAFLFSLQGHGIMQDNNDSLRGFRLDGQGATTFSADRIRVRGRRLTPTGVLKQDWEVIEHKLLTGSQSTVDFTDVPVGEFNEFELTLKNVDTDTSSNSLDFRFSTDNGSTFESGASDYHYGQWNMASETAHATVQDATAAFIRMSAAFGSSSVRFLHGTIWMGPLTGGSSKHTRCFLSALDDSGNLRSQTGAGVWVGTGSDGVTTAFRLLLGGGGNFTVGSEFTLRGRRRIE